MTILRLAAIMIFTIVFLFIIRQIRESTALTVSITSCRPSTRSPTPLTGFITTTTAEVVDVATTLTTTRSRTGTTDGGFFVVILCFDDDRQ